MSEFQATMVMKWSCWEHKYC